MTNTPRLLILGFSCSSNSNGFAPPLKQMLLDRGISQVHIAGLGGLNPTVIPPALDILFATEGPFTHVILEIATSIYAERGRDGVDGATDLARECIERIVEHRAEPAILLFKRFEMQTMAIPWNDILREQGAALDVPVFDLAEATVDELGEDCVKSMLRDVVHLTQDGERFFAQRLIDPIAQWLSAPQNRRTIHRSPLKRRFMSLSDAKNPQSVFSREGLSFPMTTIDESVTTTFDLGGVRQIYGFLYLFHPTGGIWSTRLDAAAPFEFLTYDEFSYYTRVGMRAIGPATGRPVSQIIITPKSGIPQIVLKKGEKDMSPRKGHFLGILHFSK